jgi:hypothetical protein
MAIGFTMVLVAMCGSIFVSATRINDQVHRITGEAQSLDVFAREFRLAVGEAHGIGAPAWAPEGSLAVDLGPDPDAPGRRRWRVFGPVGADGRFGQYDVFRGDAGEAYTARTRYLPRSVAGLSFTRGPAEPVVCRMVFDNGNTRVLCAAPWIAPGSAR